MVLEAIKGYSSVYYKMMKASPFKAGRKSAKEVRENRDS
ncbi:hypothetical protein SUSAZ_10985 [Sulfolobus acidocaldarius SUSAZ]|nr:hypothetical protein SUSAZ_10985 [Sulfolobus acidocaldarius SUSAZ]